MMRIAYALLLCAAALAAGCEKSPMGLPIASVPIGSRTYKLEVAVSEAAQEKGLMQRDALAADRGMIFVFPGDAIREFWMKNTRIPLDIIFLNSGGKVVWVESMKPYDLHTTSSIYPAQYAIELNAGQAKACGIKPGDQITLPPEARGR